MKKIIIPFLLFLILIATGCQQHNKKDSKNLADRSLVNIHYLAGTVGMTVTHQSKEKVTFGNDDNTVDIYPILNQAYLNSEYLAPPYAKKIDGMLHVDGKLEQLIKAKLNLKKPTIVIPTTPIIEKPVRNLYPGTSGIKIVIDPGHGGKDPGAIAVHGFYEKTVNLSVAQQIAEILKDRGFSVIMTRSNDTFIELDNRCAIANCQRANLFVSIHADSCSTKTTNGFTLYVAKQASWASKQLADSIDNQMVKTGIKSRGTKEANYRVLRYTRCPAVLIELGYLSNYWEAKKLRDKTMQKKLATAIADGITKHAVGR